MGNNSNCFRIKISGLSHRGFGKVRFMIIKVFRNRKENFPFLVVCRWHRKGNRCLLLNMRFWGRMEELDRLKRNGSSIKGFLTSMVTGSISGLGFSGLMFDNKGFGPCAPGGGTRMSIF